MTSDIILKKTTNVNDKIDHHIALLDAHIQRLKIRRQELVISLFTSYN